MKLKAITIKENALIYNNQTYQIDYTELYINDQFLGFIQKATIAVRDFEITQNPNGLKRAVLHL